MASQDEGKPQRTSEGTGSKAKRQPRGKNTESYQRAAQLISRMSPSDLGRLAELLATAEHDTCSFLLGKLNDEISSKG